MKNFGTYDKNINIELEQLIDCFGNDVLRVAYMYLKDMHKAEDAFQEVFLRVYKNYYKFKGESSLKTWIMTITMNVCKDYLKSAWFKKITFFETDTEYVLPDNIENNIIEAIEKESLLKEVMGLSPKYKEVILLYYYQELDTPEISEILNIPEGTVRSRLFRARNLLKNILTNENE